MLAECIQPLVVPESQQHLLRKTDLVPSNLNEARRFPRRFMVQEAALECLPSFPALTRSPEPRNVLLIDLSRGGLRFFCGDQLFPGEHVRVTIANMKTYAMQVAWCRRVDVACYQIGAKFVRES
jgi:hypothetical protein